MIGAQDKIQFAVELLTRRNGSTGATFIQQEHHLEDHEIVNRARAGAVVTVDVKK